jgi:hypothetical protein
MTEGAVGGGHGRRRCHDSRGERAGHLAAVAGLVDRGDEDVVVHTRRHRGLAAQLVHAGLAHEELTAAALTVVRRQHRLVAVERVRALHRRRVPRDRHL